MKVTELIIEEVVDFYVLFQAVIEYDIDDGEEEKGVYIGIGFEDLVEAKHFYKWAKNQNEEDNITIANNSDKDWSDICGVYVQSGDFLEIMGEGPMTLAEMKKIAKGGRKNTKAELFYEMKDNVTFVDEGSALAKMTDDPEIQAKIAARMKKKVSLLDTPRG